MLLYVTPVPILQHYNDGYFDGAVVAQYKHLVCLALSHTSGDATKVAQSVFITRFIINCFM